jgi:hypothetical protein
MHDKSAHYPLKETERKLPTPSTAVIEFNNMY